ncbi:Mucin-associated surface protein (MASP) [Trypanosoma cruzi]|uniref:Mucin-associated surface protein (MASP), putative n=2 Tax=Trypanosoma cruzi TaxID=5693 RepID=Q4DLA1_TRYCC|nr:mucin-associated surface protein (MASP), putative [Trypanosoma cruzi]EAN93298.1 mucin-associated surface protein (MASP), putative [Trypanosoma cruzi]PWV04156.1 Mucin-associated surface protein (MASP) [Trypanosoma cruzi]|eukprot:XP_815149.1 mucin-associated surface protein (MASP) [Trypanosoma cruzi strain CL Brener]
MAMMLTGRVLLVCALSVLWCIAGGRCDEEEEAPLVGPPLNSTSVGVSENATGHTAPSDAGVLSAEQKQLNPLGALPLQAALQPESPKEQTHSSPEHKDPLPPSTQLQEERQGGPDEGILKEPGASLSQEDKKHTSIGDQQRNDPPPASSNKDVVSNNSEESTEDTSRSAEIIGGAPFEEVQERENVTLSLEQPRETSTAAPAITNQTSSTTPPDQSESNTVKMSDATPQSIGTANTNDSTTKIDSSDSSTAVSHTTSPLLLLLLPVVACAAAAAVVAA